MQVVRGPLRVWMSWKGSWFWETGVKGPLVRMDGKPRVQAGKWPHPVNYH